MQYILYSIIGLIVLTAVPAQSFELKSLYKHCSDWKREGFSSTIYDPSSGVCIGAMSTWADVAYYTCEEKLYTQEEPPETLKMFGYFNKVEPAQLAIAIINYAEKFPADWDKIMIWEGEKIAEYAGFRCSE